MPLFGKKKDYEELNEDDLFSEIGKTMAKKDTKKASSMLLFLVGKYPDHEKGRSLLAGFLSMGDKYDIALTHYEYLIERHPNNAEYIGGRGMCHIMLDRMEEGKADLERALEIDPSLERFKKILSTMG